MTLFDSEEAMRRGDEAMNAGRATPEAARRSSSTRCLSTRSSPAAVLLEGLPKAVVRSPGPTGVL